MLVAVRLTDTPTLDTLSHTYRYRHRRTDTHTQTHRHTHTHTSKPMKEYTYAVRTNVDVLAKLVQRTITMSTSLSVHVAGSTRFCQTLIDIVFCENPHPVAEDMVCLCVFGFLWLLFYVLYVFVYVLFVCCFVGVFVCVFVSCCVFLSFCVE